MVAWPERAGSSAHYKDICADPCATCPSGRLQPTVCAHFLPDISMSGPTSPGNMSASAADTPTCDSGPDVVWVARIRPASLGGRASFTLQQQHRHRSQPDDRGSTADQLSGLGGSR